MCDAWSRMFRGKNVCDAGFRMTFNTFFPRRRENYFEKWESYFGRAGGKIILAGGKIILAGGKLFCRADGKIILAGGKLFCRAGWRIILAGLYFHNLQSCISIIYNPAFPQFTILHFLKLQFSNNLCISAGCTFPKEAT